MSFGFSRVTAALAVTVLSFSVYAQVATDSEAQRFQESADVVTPPRAPAPVVIQQSPFPSQAPRAIKKAKSSDIDFREILLKMMTEGRTLAYPKKEFCPECEAARTSFTVDKLSLENVGKKPKSEAEAKLSETERCFNRELMACAQKTAEQQFGNRDPSGGDCAFGVRSALDRCEMNPKGQGLLNAFDYGFPTKKNGGQPTLEQAGFRDIMTEDMTPENAPEGTVLVFKGPASIDYAMTGNEGDKSGHWLGHVTVKGPDGYYTDGKTREPAGRNRKLIGVFTMSKCTKCSPEIKAKCGLNAVSQNETFFTHPLFTN